MAIAGRVAIVPKGEYSNAVTYDKLDLVMFNNDAYIAKKASTGIEPTNDEYWMLILNNVVAEDLENIINGTTPVGNTLKLNGLTSDKFVQNTNGYGWTTKNFGSYDINTWIKDGVYAYSTDCTNKPHGDYGTIFVMSPDTSKVTQFGWDWTESNQPIRTRNSNNGGTTWSNWEHIGNGGNADTVDGYHATDFIPTDGKRPTLNQVSDLNEFLTGIGLFNDGALNVPESGFWLIIAGGLHGTVTQLAIDLWNSKPMKVRRCASGTWKPWEDASTGCLPLDGGTITGSVTKPLKVDSTSGVGVTLIEFLNKGTAVGSLGFRDNAPIFINADWTKEYSLLHTGNKPTGTYTGNGSATERVIRTEGLGDVCAIKGNGYSAIVFYSGAIGIAGQNSTWIGESELKFRGGTLTIATDSKFANLSGATYTYQVL